MGSVGAMTSSDDNRPSQESRRWALKASGQCVLVTILFLLGCGGSKPPLYSVGGTVTGLKGSGLVLQSPGLPDVPLSTNESFLIANAVPTGFSYAATVKVQPVNPTQQCTIVGGSGSVQQSNVSNIVVTCVNTYTLSGTVSGLSLSRLTSGVLLQNNLGNDLIVNVNGVFTFATAVPDGMPYSVTVKTQPLTPPETCVVMNGSGTLAGPVSGISVQCQHNPGTHLYVTDYILEFANQGVISAFSIGVDGTPAVFGGAGVTASGPRGIAVDPSGQFAYAVNDRGGDTNQGSVWAFAIDPLSGQPNSMPVPLYSDSRTPFAVVVDPTDRFVYIANTYGGTGPATASISAYSLNAHTGALTDIPGSPFTSPGYNTIAVDPVGKFLFVDGGTTIQGFQIDAVSGALSAINGSPITTQGRVTSLAFAPHGQVLYAVLAPVANGVRSTYVLAAYALDTQAGALHEVTGSPYLTDANGTDVVIDPLGRFAYVTSSRGGSMGLGSITGYRVDPNTGALTPLAGFPVDDDYIPGRSAIEPSGRFLYVTGQTGPGLYDGSVNAYRIDPVTGSLSLVNGAPISSGGSSPWSIAIR